MNPSTHSAQTSTSAAMPDAAREFLDAAREDDSAWGWECAHPALQIDAWSLEDVAQPLQRLA